MIKRVLILKNNLPLINKNYEPGQAPAKDNSLGDFQPIIDSISNKAIIGQQNEELIGDIKLTYKQVGPAFFVVSSDSNEEGVLEILLPELETLFFAVFPQDYIESWQGDDVSVFKGFETKLNQLRSAFENRIMTKSGSRRVLDTLSVMELPQRLQKTALSVLDAKIASFEEVIAMTESSAQQAVANIQEILNAGFLYTTKMGNKVYYSVKSFTDAPAASSRAAPAPVSSPVETTVQTSTPTQQPQTSTPVTQRAHGVEVKKRDTDKGNMPFLLKQVKKGMDKVFDAIISRKLLLILLDPESDKNQVLLNMLLDTIQCFAPERELRIVNLATDFVHPRDADIIRINRDLLQFYSNEVVLDMDNKKVIQGDSSVYLNDIIHTMSKQKHNQCVSLLINRVSLIEKIAQDWAKIKKLDLPSDDFVSTIRAKHTPAMLEIMEQVASHVYMD